MNAEPNSSTIQLGFWGKKKRGAIERINGRRNLPIGVENNMVGWAPGKFHGGSRWGWRCWAPHSGDSLGGKKGVSDYYGD